MATSNSRNKNSAPASPQKSSPEPSAKQTEKTQETPEKTPTAQKTDSTPETQETAAQTPKDGEQTLSPSLPDGETEKSEQETSTDDSNDQKTEEDSLPSDSESDDQEDREGGGVQPKSSGHKVAAPNGRILKIGDPLKFDAEEVGNYAIVKEDVYREHIARGSSRKTYTLVYTKGTAIPLSTLQKG